MKDFASSPTILSCTAREGFTCVLLHTPLAKLLDALMGVGREGLSGSKGAMSPRGPRATLLLLFLLLTLTSSWLSVDKRETPYEKFQRQHIDKSPEPSNTDCYCNKMMKKRYMTTGTCKKINTFIRSDISKVAAICYENGINIQENYYYSFDDFEITECKCILNCNSPRSDCTYIGCVRRQKICIACNNETDPVHYARPQDCTRPAPLW